MLFRSILHKYGPTNIHKIISKICLPDITIPILQRFFSIHSDIFQNLLDGNWWYINTPIPIKFNFLNLEEALQEAFCKFIKPVSIEDLWKYLCLSTIKYKPISRGIILNHLTNNSHIYDQPIRGKFIIKEAQSDIEINSCSIPTSNFEFSSNIQYSQIPRRWSAPVLNNDNNFNPIDFFESNIPLVFN